MAITNFILIPFSLILSIIIYKYLKKYIWEKTVSYVFLFVIIYGFLFHSDKDRAFILGYSIGVALIQGSIGFILCKYFIFRNLNK